jgi:outer membrane protein TolC
MTRLAYLFFALCLVCAPRQARAERWPLARLIEQLLREHPSVVAARAQVALSRARVLEQQLRWTPEGDLRVLLQSTPHVDCVDDPLKLCSQTTVVDLTRVTVAGASGAPAGVLFRFSLDGRQPIYTFGKIESAVGSAEGGLGMDQASLQGAELDVALAGLRVFAQLKTARASIDTIETAIGTMRDFLDHVESDRRGHNAFHYGETDVLRLRLQIANAQTALGDQQRNAAAALAALRALAGDAQAEVDAAELQWQERAVADAQHWRELMVQSRPEVRSGRAGLHYYASWRRLQRAFMLPNIGFGFGASAGYSPTFVNFPPLGYANLPATAGAAGGYYALSVQQPLDIGQKLVHWQQVEHEEQMQQTRYQLGLGFWSLELDKAWLDFKEASQRLTEASRGEHLTQGWYASVVENLALGIFVDGREMVEVTNTWMALRLRRLQALSDSLMTLASLYRLAGKPILGSDGVVL